MESGSLEPFLLLVGELTLNDARIESGVFAGVFAVAAGTQGTQAIFESGHYRAKLELQSLGDRLENQCPVCCPVLC